MIDYYLKQLQSQLGTIPENKKNKTIYSAFCSSPECSDGRRLYFKSIADKSDTASQYKNKPIYCPDCGYALYWLKTQ